MTQRDILRELRLILDGIRIGVAFYSISIGTIFCECTLIYILNGVPVIFPISQS